ncbi:MAG: hypothetical protein R3244_03660 [Thermoanaerobaculia bacterium]|nr:hypothetical protein [Thermoanaerobaculia bacterium]
MTSSGKNRRITAAFLAVFISIGLVWDVYVAYNEVQGDTISELVRDLSHSWYFVPWIFGVCCGHFFWNRPAEELKTKQERRKVFFQQLVPISLLVLARDLLNLKVDLPTFGYANLGLFVGGFAAGAKLWPQALPEQEVQDTEDPKETT